MYASCLYLCLQKRKFFPPYFGYVPFPVMFALTNVCFFLFLESQIIVSWQYRILFYCQRFELQQTNTTKTALESPLSCWHFPVMLGIKEKQNDASSIFMVCWCSEISSYCAGKQNHHEERDCVPGRRRSQENSVKVKKQPSLCPSLRALVSIKNSQGSLTLFCQMQSVERNVQLWHPARDLTNILFSLPA